MYNICGPPAIEFWVSGSEVKCLSVIRVRTVYVMLLAIECWPVGIWYRVEISSGHPCIVPSVLLATESKTVAEFTGLNRY